MKIIIDTNVLVPMITGLKPNHQFTNPANGQIISNVDLRSKALIDLIELNKGVILIPTPVLAEYLLGIEREMHFQHVNLINSMKCFEISPFEEISAMECALLPTLKELRQMSKESCTANKIKFDRQIIAIAKATNADEVWTHDKGIYDKCKELNLSVKSFADIEPIPEQFNIPDDVFMDADIRH